MRAAARRLRDCCVGLLGRPTPAPAAVREADDGIPSVDFLCNVCGQENRRVPLHHVQNREYQSCAHCRSSLRMRSVVHALSVELFGRPLVLPEFPADKAISGLGMSDWEGYAMPLAERLAYQNTFYHAPPRLDITDIRDEDCARQRFLISSDVFEHIPVALLDQAFRNSRRLLNDAGVFIFTVPYAKEGRTVEHFPNLHQFSINETDGKRVLHNVTRDGQHETFEDLIFHGGDGMTLEMRMFSEPDLLRSLQDAGYRSTRIYTDCVEEFGILWPMDWAVPIVARA